MAQLGRVVKCTRCLKEQSIAKVRYSDDGKSIICLECYSKLHPERLKSEAKPLKQKLAPSTAVVNANEIQYRCTDCNYRFKSKKTINEILRCPYCSKTNLKVENKNEIH